MTSPEKAVCLTLDLGTTTLAGRVFKETDKVLAEGHLANPQRKLAADILFRLQAAHEQGGAELQGLLLEGLSELIASLLESTNSSPADVETIVAAGNPGMSCLLRNLPVDSLLFPPHKPPFKELTEIPASEIDLGLSQPLQLFPLVSGFVGGDLVACLLSLGDVKPGTLLIDLGTNAELALWDGSRWWVTSAAAGPAFEGGNIDAGMVMGDGAVTDVNLVDDRLQLTVAGGGPPKGLCGSGLAALVAAGCEGCLIDKTGRILCPEEVETNLGRYLVEKEDGWALRFHRSAVGELVLTQGDLRNFQLAKGAVLAGVQVLLEKGGFMPEDVSQVFVTGALGTSLSTEVLKRVALLPEPMLDRTSFVANGVLAGLQSYLAATDGRGRLETLLRTVQPFPLSGTPTFEKLFLASLDFQEFKCW